MMANPITIILALMATGIIVGYKRKLRLASNIILIIAFCSLFLLSFNPISNILIWGLEKRNEPIEDVLKYSNVRYVVVLSAWDSDNPTVPYTSNIGYRTTHRILEAHRILSQNPNLNIVLSGTKTSTTLMKNFLIDLGINKEKIYIDNNSKNTMQNAKNCKNLIKDKRFFLVTSAIHMPRSLMLFCGQGLKPIPAPADFYYGYYDKFHIYLKRPFRYYLPTYDTFWRSCLALHEYLAFVYYKYKYSWL